MKPGKSKIKTLAGLVSNESLISVNVCFFWSVSLVAEKAQQLSAGSFVKDTDPIHEGICSHDLIISKNPSPNNIPMGMSFQLMNFLGKQKMSIYSYT